MSVGNGPAADWELTRQSGKVSPAFAHGTRKTKILDARLRHGRMLSTLALRLLSSELYKRRSSEYR